VKLLVVLSKNLQPAKWHAYDRNVTGKGHREFCNLYNVDNNERVIQRNNPMRLWPNLFTKDDIMDENVIYGFNTAIREVWTHQHPLDCSRAKFMISSGWMGGFASVPHVEGVALAIAMELGRILLPHPDGVVRGAPRDFGFHIDHGWQVDNEYCRNQNTTSLDCYYESWSSCTIEDALRGRSIKDIPDIWLNELDIIAIRESGNTTLPLRIRRRTRRFRVIQYINYFNHFTFIPKMLRPIADCSPMRNGFQYYWWRAISATYMMRPNARTLAEIEKYSTLTIDWSKETCVAAHVRLGDKGAEMKLVPLDMYLLAAENLWEQGIMRRGPEQNVPVLFISSDDPEVYVNATLWGKLKGWRVVYTSLVDKAKLSSRLDHIALEEAKRSPGGLQHHEFEYFSMILNLDYALRCHAWICPLQSNTCRLIDEMRATVGGKAASGIFVDVSYETCAHPPCYNGEGVVTFGW